ncbi:MAG: hypothetical protein JW741_23095 [Sedimentisphaerales bacterium]|nr:hypothetical protein [Sedimentisphaerales bacterium]
MAEQFKNLASTTLDGAIDDEVTTITVASAMGFTGGDFRILVDSEIMKVTAVSGLDFTVTRGAEGTSPSSHDNGAAVKHVLTAGALDAHDQDDLVVRDAYDSKPAAGVPGRLFLPTDGIFMERDNGSAWEKFGPLWPMTPPQASDFPTWVNQGSATIADNKGAIWLETPCISGTNVRACVKPYPSTPFTLEMALIPCMAPNSGNVVAGLCIRDSVSGKLQMYGFYDQEGKVSGRNYSGPTAYASAVTGWPGSGYLHMGESNLLWIKYEDDDTNRKISISADGCSWSQIVNLARTDYLTPTQIGVFIYGYQSTPVQNQGATFLHWKEY